ncbi:MAG: methyltransferase [Clostridia bacterium]|nr:methyltransferase [Clostridia bacterium]
MSDRVEIKVGERVDDLLVNGLKIIQNPSAFCFGCDAVELANFVTGGIKDRAVDLGSGTGIITILLAGKKNIRCTGVEIQPQMAEMSERSIALNGLTNADIINAPMQKITQFIAPGSATIVVCNPPYRKPGSGQKQENESVALARHEIAVTLKEVVQTAKALLSTGGSFYIIHQTQRLAEVMHECKSVGLEPKILQVLSPQNDKPPHLFMLKCTYGGAEGMTVLPQRIVNTIV